MNTHDILDALNGADDKALFAEAHRTRQRVFGNKVYIQAVIEISTVCDSHCRYCRQRTDNARLRRQRMCAGHILDTAALAVAQGAGTIVLRSGNDPGCSMELVGELIRSIKAQHDTAVTLSLGDRGLDEYAFWRECGADRCLLNLETTDRNLYKRVRQGEDLSARLHRLEGARGLGFEVGSGVMAGLPGTTPIDALRDILFLTDLDLGMISTGPFVPRQDTPMAGCAPGSVLLSNRMTALLRVLNPGTNIPVNGLCPKGLATALARGCNVLMPPLTAPGGPGYRIIHHGREQAPPYADPSPEQARRIIEGSGFVPSAAKGLSPGRHHVG